MRRRRSGTSRPASHVQTAQLHDTAFPSQRPVAPRPRCWPSISSRSRRSGCNGSTSSSSSSWAAVVCMWPGCTPNPSAAWVIQQARQLSWTLAERSEPMRFLIRDRDQKFTDGFDDVFRSDGIEVVRTPARAPQANGVAERFVRTVRTECFDRLLVLNQQHLERILEVFVDHYNRHRPHRALSLAPPEARRSVASSSALGDPQGPGRGDVRRRADRAAPHRGGRRHPRDHRRHRRPAPGRQPRRAGARGPRRARSEPGRRARRQPRRGARPLPRPPRARRLPRARPRRSSTR